MPAPRKSATAPPAPEDSPLRKQLMAWLDIAVKLTAPAAVVVVAVMGHSLQGSLTTSQMLTQREHSDTTIRAEMFKSISERLFGDKTGKPLTPGQKAVFAELLALNFHEHIELKPLLHEVDQALTDAGRGASPAQARQVESRRVELQSIARRVRQRQMASLLQGEGPAQAKPMQAGMASFAPTADISGKVQVISVRLKGFLPGVPGARRSACDPPGGEIPAACVREPMFSIAPSGRSMLSISVLDADPAHNSVHLRVKPSLIQPGDSGLLAAGTPWAGECSKKLDESNPHASGASSGSTPVDFDATWFDFPLTDNTLLANGDRYAIFIDDLCFDDGAGQQTVKLGLLWFPKDYFPARERPTNFRELRRKLGLNPEG